MPFRALTLVAMFAWCPLLGATGTQRFTPVTEFREGFETPSDGAPVSAWQTWKVVTGHTTVTHETSYSGNSSLKIEATEPAGQVVFPLPPTGDKSVLFVDFRLRPVAMVGENATNTVDAVGALAGVLLVGTDGKLLAYDASSGGWRAVGTSWPTNPDNSVAQWVRVTLRLDLAAKIWDLYVEGKMVAANLGLEPTSSRQLILYGDLHAPVYVDDLYASASNPLFVDYNQDGLPDGWAVAHAGAGTESQPTRADLDTTTGMSLLDEYQQAVEVLSKPGKLYARPFVFVHPTLNSAKDFAAVIQALDGASPSGDADEQALRLDLINDLKQAEQAWQAGLPGPAWKLAPDLARAVEIADSKAELLVFPSAEPFVLSGFNPKGKSLSIRCLSGVVISTPNALTQGRQVQAEARTRVLDSLSERPWLYADKVKLESLWPEPILPSRKMPVPLLPIAGPTTKTP